MNKKLKLLTVSTLLAVTISFAGCDFFDRDVGDDSPLPPIESPETSAAEDRAVQDFLGTYFTDLFSRSAEDYSKNLIEGSIPGNIVGHLADRTVTEGDNNPEIGIHFPRLVEFGGITMMDYKIMTNDSGTPMINAAYVGKTGNSFLYFVRVDIKAKGLPIDIFYDYYEQDEETLLFKKLANLGGKEELKDKDYDEIKVQLKYDVEVIQENNSYKVLTQREANFKTSFKSRRVLLNNEFVDRLPYLDVNISAENSIYEEEKALISAFFNNLLKIDRERMSLLRNNWDIGFDSFVDFLERIEVKKSDGRDLLLIDEETYKEKFSVLAFPLQAGIRRIVGYDGFNVIVHPGYSRNNKVYFVKIIAIAEKASGIISSDALKARGVVGSETNYSYDYVVTLDSNENGPLMISAIKLEEYLEVK